VISDNTIWPILGSVSLTWQHTIQQELLPSFIMYPVAFWHFRTSLILFCMFLTTGWRDLITDTFLCPITCELGAPVQLSMSGNLHTWASYLVRSHKSSSCCYDGMPNPSNQIFSLLSLIVGMYIYGIKNLNLCVYVYSNIYQVMEIGRTWWSSSLAMSQTLGFRVKPIAII
jgi:hypothetical protein